MSQKFQQMFGPVFRLLLFRGSPVDVNGSLPTIATFAILLVALVWLTLPTAGSLNLSEETVAALRKVFAVIPIISYALVALMVFTVLSVRRLNDRFPKTISAGLGLLLLFQAGMFVLYILSLFLRSILGFFFGVAEVALYVWFIGAGGYVLQHAFNLKLYQGILAVIVILLLATVIAGIITGLVLPDEVKILGELQRQLLDGPSSK